MDLFHIIDGEFAILTGRGVYRQAKLFRRGNELFAGYGSGFVKLMANGGTTHPHVSWIEVSIATVEGRFGAPCLPDKAARTNPVAKAA